MQSDPAIHCRSACLANAGVRVDRGSDNSSAASTGRAEALGVQSGAAAGGSPRDAVPAIASSVLVKRGYRGPGQHRASGSRSHRWVSPVAWWSNPTGAGVSEGVGGFDGDEIARLWAEDIVADRPPGA